MTKKLSNNLHSSASLPLKAIFAQPLTQSRLKELFHYDPDTGIFTRRVSVGRFLAGQSAGHRTKRGYIKMSVDGGQYHAHRLAMLYMNGDFPKHLVDHINRDPSDNRWKNLRQVTSGESNRNRGLRKDSKTNVTGVAALKTGKFEAYIKDSGHKKHLGVYPTVQQAAHARYKGELMMWGEKP